MKKLLILFIIPFITMSSLYSQNKTIKGRVIAEDLDILPGVSIMINDTIDVGKTDMNGFFKIETPVLVKKISFLYVGMESATIELVDNCNIIEFVMMYNVNYDFMSLKRVEKERIKRYKKLIDVHKKAFEKGIFEAEYACFISKFESLATRRVK